ncbi:MAG: tetratricopeptide repeat protein [Planctomycetota bacterium]|jgi:tetratricopeptide (TPR) repeat protein
MKKHKKIGQRKKKPGKITQRKRAVSGQSRGISISRHRQVMRTIVVVALLCAAAVGVFVLKSLFDTEGEQTVKNASQRTHEEVVLPVRGPIRTEQDLAELKKEEMALAEKLMGDFKGDVDALIIMGNVHFRYGDAVKASDYYKKALQINPRRADVYDVMGQFALKQGEFQEAIGHWRKALTLNPRLPTAHSNIGHALMILGRGDEALEELKREIAISPQSGLAYFLLGQAYKMEEDYARAKENYETAVRIDPKYANAYYGLVTVCTKLGEKDEAREYSETFKKLKADARKDLKGRKIVYDDVVETKKHAALTYIEVGRMYRDNGQPDQAEKLLLEAVALDPEDATSLEELASLYQAAGRLSKALATNRMISRIQPQNAICIFRIGILSAKLGLLDDAEDSFAKVIELAPQQPGGYRELAVLYLRKKEKLSRARELAEKALALKADAPNYFTFAWACAANEDYAKALNPAKRAVDMEPGNQQYRSLYQQIQRRN